MFRLGKQIFAIVGLLLLTMAIIGCGSIARSVARSVLHGQESAQDRSLCEKSCSDRTGDAYSLCYTECLSLQERKRQDKTREMEHEDALRSLKTYKDR